MKSIDQQKNTSSSWYPGHMLKAEREIKAKKSLVDLVLEIVDARAPSTTLNRKLSTIYPNKPRIVVLNKIDLADTPVTNKWVHYFEEQKISCALISKYDRNVRKILIERIRSQLLSCSNDNLVSKFYARPQRIMVVGMPNVGKSSLINRMIGRKKVKVAPFPGVTRDQQWIKIDNALELLDTPGIMPPRIDTKQSKLLLGLLSIIKETLCDPWDLAEYLFYELKRLNLEQRIVQSETLPSISKSFSDFVEKYGTKRKVYTTGHQIDLPVSAQCFVTAFQKGKYGRISFEAP